MKENLIILFVAIILSLVLLLPSRFAAFQQEPAALVCPLFTDENQDTVCDILQDIQIQSTQGTEFNFSFWPQALIFTLLLTLSILIQISGKSKWLRIYVLIFSILYLGFFWPKICPIATFQSLFLQKEKIVLHLPLFIIFILPIATTLLFGRIFCHFLCPLGGAQELIFRIPRRVCTKIPNLTARIPKKLFYLPYIILLILILGTLFTSSLFLCRFEPWGRIFGCNNNILAFFLLLSTLIFSLFIFRPFCNLFCPLGIIFKFLEKFRIWRPKNSISN